MDHKAFKSDMTYALKKMVKEGKTITCEILSDNLELVDGKITLPGDKVDVLEALVLVKGWAYTPAEYVDKWTDSQGSVHETKWFYHEAFGIPLSDIISEQGQLSRTDLYDFMDGLENVVGNDKTEFYKIGVYIREKFTPVGTRDVVLPRTRYLDGTSVKTERKFIVYNRPMPGCRKTGAPSIVEVECEVFIPFLAKNGEYAARVLKPEWLWEPTRILKDGVLVDETLPQTYCGHAFYDTIELARAAAKQQVKGGLDFEVRKGKIPSYTEEDLKVRCDLIQEVLMS